MSTREQALQALQALPEEQVPAVLRLLDYLKLIGRGERRNREPIPLAGRWKDKFPPDFDVESALSELRRAEQEHFDREWDE